MFGLNCPSIAGEVGLGYDFFRSIPDGDWDGNTGGYASFNLAKQLPCNNFGVQFGGSYGLYDWQGRGSAPSSRQGRIQQQLFLTGGVFRLTQCQSGFNGGVVYDWMWNQGYGLCGVQTSFGQVRLQGGYLCRCTNEYGLWGTIDTNRSHRDCLGVPLIYRSLAQVNAYWKHIFKNQANTVVWAGVPYKRSLSYSTGRAGKFIIGGSFHAPLNGRFCIDGYASYMVPHSSKSSFYKERYYAANICIELKYFFGDHYNAVEPYMPIGNNSNFIADTNFSY